MSSEPETESDLLEEDAFCDIEEFYQDIPDTSINDAIHPLVFHPVTYSEDSLKEDIQKVDNLRPDEVRWFYLSSKTKNWKAFLGRDSLYLEKAWRSSAFEKACNKVCVRGGMFEVDVIEMKCYPVYWSPVHESIYPNTKNVVSVLRGTWFFEVNWQPLDEAIATRIEREHLARFMGYNIDHIKELMGNKVMHSVQLDGCHVEWSSVTDVLFYKDATAHRALRNIVTKFGVSKATTSGYRLHRGYKEDAMVDETHPPVSNLVLVIHGVGAKSDRCKIVRNTGSFRAACRRLEMKHFQGRTEFLPIEWRSELKLDGDLVESITPKKGQGMRKFINNTAMDIMYYTSPLFRHEIINGLRSQINKLYAMFMQRNPNFTGKIIIFSHSLGSVLFFDILTNYLPLGHGVSHPSNEMHGDLSHGLDFKPDMLFCVGSPLGMFLCLRGYHPKNFAENAQNLVDPSICRKMYNIYHPADPVAYRLEPILCENYSNFLPFQISSYASLCKTSPGHNITGSPTNERKEMEAVQSDENSADDTASTSEDMHKSPSYLRSMSNAVTGGAVRLGRGLWSKARGNSVTSNNGAEIDGESPPADEQNQPEPEIDLEERIDYELPEGFTERKLGYASFTSHTSYWTNQDLGMFLLTKLYEE
uniref:Phospholipase DDHD1-like n=1 Tax=Phallusia mammillata TaxID=59560 RepID=A0A6F9D9Y7_9ASCI|nr:phospholipase DDHD1-like [Phallusia mammillata]